MNNNIPYLLFFLIYMLACCPPILDSWTHLQLCRACYPCTTSTLVCCLFFAHGLLMHALTMNVLATLLVSLSTYSHCLFSTRTACHLQALPAHKLLIALMQLLLVDAWCLLLTPPVCFILPTLTLLPACACCLALMYATWCLHATLKCVVGHMLAQCLLPGCPLATCLLIHTASGFTL